MDCKKGFLADMADHRTNFFPSYRHRFIDHDLRGLAQAVGRRRFNLNPNIGRVFQFEMAGEGQHCYCGVFTKQIRLNNQGRPGFSKITCHYNGDQITRFISSPWYQPLFPPNP
jgi:hypothetical protein